MLIEIKTMGCRLNHAETAAIAGALEADGHDICEASATTTPNIPDAFLLHTCAVTGAAQNEALRLTRSAKKRGIPIVAVSGCGVGASDCSAFSEAGADLVIDKNNRAVTGDDQFNLGRIILSAASIGGGASSTTPKPSSTRAFVKIQDGCNFRCAYCIVPDARGAPVSRSADETLREIEALGARGFREFVLTGVNVAMWRHNSESLCGLISKISALDCVSRIRLSSIEPATTESAVIDLMSVAESRLCHALHYPLQSADNNVLRLMRRRYTAEQYAATLDYAASKIPRLGLGADVITGFPGETDAAFENTRAFILARPFTYLHVFPYSERPGTPAAEMPNKVPVNIRRDRARELIAIGKEKSAAFAKSLIGAELEALIERVDPDGAGHGWTSEYAAARVTGLSPSDSGRVIRFIARSANDAVVGNSLLRHENADANLSP